MVKPTSVHWVAAKHILRHLRGIVDYGLMYKQVDGVKLEGFTDVDWERGSTKRKSTSGCAFNVGSVVVSRFSRK